MLTPFCPQTIECICTYYISVCIRSGLILLLRSLHCIYWDHRAVGSGAWGLWWFKTPIPHPLAGSKTISSISPRIIPLPSWFSGLPTPLDGVVVGKNSSKQMCMTKTGWCCCVTRPHFSPHASSNRAVCSVPHAAAPRRRLHDTWFATHFPIFAGPCPKVAPHR